MNKINIEKAIKVILKEIGEDTEREGIKFTPTRVARLYENLFYGYRKKLIVMNEEERNSNYEERIPYTSSDIIPITVFKTTSHEMLIRKVNFNSFCEHHLVPFVGKCWVGIIPSTKLLGMNKIDKIVKYFAARLQLQERLTTQVADWIQKNIKPKGVMVVIKADHLCASLQGDNGNFTTSAIRGIFSKKVEGVSPKEEFLQLITEND